MLLNLYYFFKSRCTYQEEDVPSVGYYKKNLYCFHSSKCFFLFLIIELTFYVILS